MILFPAIDLKNGECVRLVQGDMARATVFNADPAAQAQAFAAQGFDYLHVVDLDGAFAGRPVNADAVRGVLARLTIKLQLGGGIRDLKTVRGWLESGVTRVIIGTAAVRDPDFVREAARLYPGRIAVGVDAREGIVAIEGWAKTSDISALDLARRFQDAGVAAIIYTDIARDGALAGINVESTIALADALDIPVVASGGLASIEDVRRLMEPDCARLAGAIVGRALYDGRLDPRAALALLRSKGDGGGSITHPERYLPSVRNPRQKRYESSPLSFAYFGHYLLDGSVCVSRGSNPKVCIRGVAGLADSGFACGILPLFSPGPRPLHRRSSFSSRASDFDLPKGRQRRSCFPSSRAARIEKLGWVRPWATDISFCDGGGHELASSFVPDRLINLDDHVCFLTALSSSHLLIPRPVCIPLTAP